jgi:magnesium-transporting ATPase (P-type)
VPTWHVLSREGAVHELHVEPEQGLTSAEAACRSSRSCARSRWDLDLTRQRYPRVAELPFDTAYKLVATFHRMADESGRDVIRCFVKGAPDQLLARSSLHP